MFIIASNKKWRPSLAFNVRRLTGFDCVSINKLTDLSIESLNELKPITIFFPHWSYIIPAEIYERYECIIFHMTDVPFGRGGSPLQNLISRGIYETQISAIRCVKELDAGPVYMKRPLSLYGNAQEIYMRASQIIEDMIVSIILDQPTPYIQVGDPVVFKRRTPEQGNIANLESLQQIYDYIRMLDAEGYPKAFLQCGNIRLEFERASITTDSIKADVVIRLNRDA
jgi:methionyl-tRNA formyltransferase